MYSIIPLSNKIFEMNIKLYKMDLFSLFQTFECECTSLTCAIEVAKQLFTSLHLQLNYRITLIIYGNISTSGYPI